MTARSAPGAPRRATPPAGLEDHVDRLLREWTAERPDLEVGPVAVVYRVMRLASAWRPEIDGVFDAVGLVATDFAVLANLRRAGAPYRLTQRQLMEALRLTSGTVSVRIDKLVQRGLVDRSPDPTDGRATLVTLTDEGHAMFDRVAPRHLENEARLTAALTPAEADELARLLRTLLVDLEQPAERRPDAPLGFRVAPGAEARRRRAAAGLPRAPGLLVEDVTPGGPADRAGLRVGDLLTGSGPLALTSLLALEQAVATHAAKLPLTVQRAGGTVKVSVPLG